MPIPAMFSKFQKPCCKFSRFTDTALTHTMFLLFTGGYGGGGYGGGGYDNRGGAYSYGGRY